MALLEKPEPSAAVSVCAGQIPCVLLANSTVCFIDLTYSEFAWVMSDETSDKVSDVHLKNKKKNTLKVK